jgi:murein DD-endopeptidase MepM/ murein hydrolase activator NlpD
LYTLVASSRKKRIISASAVMLSVVAFSAVGVAPLAPDASDLPVRSISQEIALPSLAEQITALSQQDPQYVREEKVRAGDSLASLMTRLGVDDAAAASFIKSDKVARAVMQLRSGKRVQVQTDALGQLQWLRTTVVTGTDANNIEIDRKGETFTAVQTPAELERRVEMRARNITSTLYAATDSDSDGSKLPDSIVAQILEMFSNNIDFRNDLKRGDHFNVVYETFWQDGELVRTGRILAGEFVNRGKSYQSVWFQDPENKQGGSYYSMNGTSLKKAFLKSPLAYSRISSVFSMRLHPIDGHWKQHKGVDFAAPVGTPIRASGDGTVQFVGTQNGYGNFVVLKHWSNYSTAYGHMKGFAAGLRKGDKVAQGQIIGYVGMTGWSTGPHLHYEFRVSNSAVDPMKINVTAQAPLSPAELARFRMVSTDMTHRFSLLRPNDTAVAQR